MIHDYTNMVLRYYVDENLSSDRVNQLFDFLERSGVHRVILFSATFAGMDSFPSLEYYKKHAEAMGKLKKQLEPKGIEVGINILFTLGHCYWSGDNKTGFKRAVTINGGESRGCACMRDENWIEYVKTLYSYYAKINPSVIFIDDDLRSVSLGEMTCFCDEHIKLMSKRCNTELDRQKLKKHILSEEGKNDKIKQEYYNQIAEDRAYVTDIICSVVKEISPKTEIGIMTDSYPMLTLGLDLKGFFNDFFDKGVKRVRTHMNYYREADRKDIPLEFSMPAMQRALINDNRVECQPEIENDTYGFFYKSNTTTDLQIVWCLTNGLRNMQLNIFSFNNCPADNYDEICSMFESQNIFYKSLTELIPYNHITEGVSIYFDNNAMLARRTKDDNPFYEENWVKWLQLQGIPMGYEFEKSPWKFLSGDTIDAASNENIDSYLKSGALIDLRAAEVLVKRGFGKRIGIRSINDLRLEYAGEIFNGHELNGKQKYKQNSDYFMHSLIPESFVKDITYSEEAQVLSDIVDAKKNTVCKGIVIYENEFGERFCIMPTDTNVFSQFTNVNHRRKEQLINIFTWIARQQLPVCAENELLCVNINKLDRYNVISLFNLQCDDIKNPKIKYNVLGKLEYLDTDGNTKAIDYTVENGCVIINKELRASKYLVLIDKF